MSDEEGVRRQVLQGLLALQNGFLDREEWGGAMTDWAGGAGGEMGSVLAGRGRMDAEAGALLEALVAWHVARGGGSVGSGLGALASRVPAGVRERLAEIDDPALAATVTYLGSGATSSGTPTELIGEGDAAGGMTAAEVSGGPYRKMRRLAEGHLGIVSVAEDVALRREVALKEIQPRNADDPASRRRFVREAEITGGLEHPGIVPIYGLGLDGAGRPYYAMRLIRGETLRQALRRHHGRGGDAGTNPGLRKLLGRFLDVCNAIAYAHGRGMVHRDIKPDNIMLAPYGETLVVDWGLARAIVGEGGVEASGSAPGAGEVETARIVGTPAYMGPEVLEGRIGTSGDVYSLGATLYVVLTGRPAFSGVVNDVLEAVVAGRFPPPRRVAPGTPRALEAICLKAMARRPEDRYATAGELAEDIERWLADEPATAYRDPLPVRARRWMRRHPSLASGAAMLVIAAVVGLAVHDRLIGRERARTEAARARAEAHFAEAREVVDRLLAPIADNLAVLPWSEAMRRRVADASVERYEGFLRERPADPAVRRQAAGVFRVAANLGRLLGRDAPAGVLYDRAVTLLDGDAAARGELAFVRIDRGEWHRLNGRPRAAEADAEAALALVNPRPGDGPEEGRLPRAIALLNRGALRGETGRFDASRADFAAALELLDSAPGGDRFAPLLALLARVGVGAALRDGGMPSARTVLEEAVAKGEALRRRRPFDLSVLAALGNAQVELGRAGAVGAYGDGIRILADVYRQHPLIPAFRRDLAAAFAGRAEARLAAGSIAESLRDAEQARRLLSPRGAATAHFADLGGLGRVEATLSRLARRRGDAEEARRLAESAAAHLDAALRLVPESWADRRAAEGLRAEGGG